MADTTVHRFGPLMGAYRVETAPPLDITGCSVAQTGIARFAAGRRSPTSGFKQGCIHEVDYVISGRLRVDTPSDTYEIRAGDVVVANPDEPHATTAIEDSEIFFVLLDPFRS